MPMYNLIGYSDDYSKTLGVYDNIIEMSQIIFYQIFYHSNLRKK